MFAVIQSGKPVRTDLQQVDGNKFALVIPECQSANHIVVFLTGMLPFQPGYGATVHLGWPKDNPADPNMSWQYLGFITNEKPSAIFKISDRRPPPAAYSAGGASASMDAMMDSDLRNLSERGVSITAQLGISIEPLELIQQQQQNQQQLLLNSPGKSSPLSASPGGGAGGGGGQQVVPMAIARKLLNHFYNFVLSFASDGKDQGMKIMQAWHASVERRLNLDPDFLNRPDN